MSRGADVIVVGGGVIGSATAYYLAKEGLDVCLVDRGDVGSGTSSACDGNVLATDKEPGFDSQMTLKSQLLFRDLQDELGYDFEYRQRGSTLAIEDEEQEMVGRDWVSRQVAAGLPMRYVEREEVHDLEPMIADDIIGLVECASDLSLNPMALVFAFVRAAERLGARIVRFREVKGILRDVKGAVRGVDTADGPLAAKTAVLAAGVWSPFIAKTVGLDLPVIPRKGAILVSERTFEVGRRKVMEFGYLMTKFGGGCARRVEPEMDRYGIALVFEPTPHGNFLIGSSREFVGFDRTCTSEVLALMARRAIRFFPIIKDIKVIRSYAGLRPYTPDHLPIVSPVDGVPGLYVATGHEGDGIGLSPITGKVISEMITGKPTSIPVEPLRLDRFEKKAAGTKTKASAG